MVVHGEACLAPSFTQSCPQGGNGLRHPTTTDQHSTPLSLVPSACTWVSGGVSSMDSPPWIQCTLGYIPHLSHGSTKQFHCTWT